MLRKWKERRAIKAHQKRVNEEAIAAVQQLNRGENEFANKKFKQMQQGIQDDR